MAKSSGSGSRLGLARRAPMVCILTLTVQLVGFAGSADAAGTTVNITDYGFAPSPVTITAGQTVTWVNKGAVPHWVEPGDVTYGGGFAPSPKIAPGGKYTAKFSSIGTFTYHDALYPFMSGTVLVKAAPAVTPRPTAKPTARPTARPTAKPTTRPIARATAKPTANATARPTPKPTAAAAATASATAAAAAESPGPSEGPVAAGAPTGSGSAGPGSATSGGSSNGEGVVGTGTWIVLLGLLGLAFVGGIWFATSRRTATASGFQGADPRAAPAAEIAVNPVSKPHASLRPHAALPSEVDEDAPLESRRRGSPVANDRPPEND